MKRAKIFNIIQHGDQVFVRDHELRKIVEFKSMTEAIQYVEERRESDGNNKG